MITKTETKTELPPDEAFVKWAWDNGYGYINSDALVKLFNQANDTLRTRLEAVEKDLEEQRIVNKELNKPIQDVCLAGRHGMKSYVELEDELTKAEKANGELVSRIEQALAHLVEAGSNKKHDPSWIRPMTMTRKEVNDACIQAYHQLQTCLDTAEAMKGE